jgi:hypothetical protein
MHGPNSLHVGQVIYLKPDGLEDLDKPDATIDDLDTAVHVVEWPGGGLAFVDLKPYMLYIPSADSPGQWVPKERLGQTEMGMVMVNKIGADLEWYATQRDAILAAVDEEVKYARACDARAAAARRIAGESTPPAGGR